MAEDMSKIYEIKIDYQFNIWGSRIKLKSVNHQGKFTRAFYKRLIQNGKAKNDLFSLPVIINNFNRLSFLKQQLQKLKELGYRNIYIIDNKSTYDPLLQFYKNSEEKIFYLDQNVGFLALWRTIIYEYFKDDYYIYTDSDIVPSEECPRDFIHHFKNLLDKYKDVDKVGFGLKINDLPTCYRRRAEVQEHEKEFWTNTPEKDVYSAMIDTTLALYRPKKKGGYWLKALRTGGNYTARHLPWYVDSENLSEEELYYLKNIKTNTHWSALSHTDEVQ